MVKDGALSHIFYFIIFFFFTIFKKILNLEGHPNCITGSKVMVILLNGWLLPIGGVALGRVCACSVHSRLVSCLYIQIL